MSLPPSIHIKLLAISCCFHHSPPSPLPSLFDPLLHLLILFLPLLLLELLLLHLYRLLSLHLAHPLLLGQSALLIVQILNQLYIQVINSVFITFKELDLHGVAHVVESATLFG